MRGDARFTRHLEAPLPAALTVLTAHRLALLEASEAEEAASEAEEAVDSVVAAVAAEADSVAAVAVEDADKRSWL